MDAANDLAPDIRADLDAFAMRHRHDPPLAVLRAASADALPSSLQDDVAGAMTSSRWRQQIVAGAHDAEAAADLTPAESDALLARIHREAAAPTVKRLPFTRLVVRVVVPFAAVAALVYLAVIARPPASAPAALPDTTPPAAATPVAPAVHHIQVEAAPVKLTASALVRRSPGRGGVFTDDAAPAFSAYRAGRYAEAAEALTRLTQTYPASPEAAFYLGVSRLLSGDNDGALTALAAARRINDPIFRDDVAWYTAAADERAGHFDAARQELTALCQGHSAFAARACDAASHLPAK